MNYNDIEIDVHGYFVDVALKKIIKIAIELSEKKISSFVVIHGYSHGCSILNAVRSLDKKCRRIRCVYPEPFNEGRSIVCLK